MAVESVTSSTAASTASTSSSSSAMSASLDYDNFLQLLIAQMENQDPTDPMDASEQVAQLATFSQVEQSIQTNTYLESLIASNALNIAASYIGKTITSADGETTGVIASVDINSDSIVATTTEGDEITIDVGVTVSETSTDDA